MTAHLIHEGYEKNDFIEWILKQKNDDYEIQQDNDNAIRLITDFATASINFTEVEEAHIIVEFNITANKDDATKFYLHFQLNDEQHAKQLYHEMTESLLDLKNKRTIQVLLSCSAGLTTSMFASELNSTSEMLGLDYQFDAVPYTNIYQEAEKYDVILIAPQIGYMKNRLAESLHDKLVLQIPTSLFAAYDSFSVIKFVQDEMQKFYFKNTKEEKTECYCDVNEKKRILSIVILPNKAQTRMYYRLYQKGQIIDNNLIIRPSTNYDDLNDIIDTMLAKHRYIDIIGIATPGVVDADGKLKYIQSETVNIKEQIENKYNIKTYVFNNVNAAALGFSSEHKEYQNIIFHSQPFGYEVGGQGIIANGQLIFGKNGIAGEVRFFLRRMQLSDETRNLVWSTQGVLELVTKSLLPSIAIFGPEAVVIRSPMTSDMDEIKKKLSSFIPDEYMPDFYYVKEASSYMLDGTVRLCMEMNKQEKSKN